MNYVTTQFFFFFVAENGKIMTKRPLEHFYITSKDDLSGTKTGLVPRKFPALRLSEAQLQK